MKMKKRNALHRCDHVGCNKADAEAQAQDNVVPTDMGNGLYKKWPFTMKMVDCRKKGT